MLRTRDPLYSSADVVAKLAHTRIEVTGVAVVMQPAMSGLKPIEILVGNAVYPEVRQRWRLPRRDRIERAGVCWRRRTLDDDVLVIREPPPVVEQIGSGTWLVDGELVANWLRRVSGTQTPERWTTGTRPAGPLRHGPRGRILSVR